MPRALPGRVLTWDAKRTLHARLLHAAGSQDPVALERVADRLGVAGLRAILASADAKGQRAAALAAPQLHESWYLLPAVTALLGHADPAVAEAAAAAARAISEDLRPGLLARHEESAATLEPAVAGLLRVAGDPQARSPARVAALQAVAQLGAVLPIAEARLLRLLQVPDEAVRSAAAEALVANRTLTTWAPLAQVVASDPSADVARATAVAICADLPQERQQRTLALATLRNAGALQRLRALAARPGAAVDELVELITCLGASADARDRRAVRRLRRSPAVRRALAHIGR